ncbi:MAG: hypothetical protein JNM11_06605 [Chitinimonas sp.]|nr:hypothetical protein [Chitinimonas sp.]
MQHRTVLAAATALFYQAAMAVIAVALVFKDGNAVVLERAMAVGRQQVVGGVELELFGQLGAGGEADAGESVVVVFQPAAQGVDAGGGLVVGVQLVTGGVANGSKWVLSDPLQLGINVDLSAMQKTRPPKVLLGRPSRLPSICRWPPTSRGWHWRPGTRGYGRHADTAARFKGGPSKKRKRATWGDDTGANILGLTQLRRSSAKTLLAIPANMVLFPDIHW